MCRRSILAPSRLAKQKKSRTWPNIKAAYGTFRFKVFGKGCGETRFTKRVSPHHLFQSLMTEIFLAEGIHAAVDGGEQTRSVGALLGGAGGVNFH